MPWDQEPVTYEWWLAHEGEAIAKTEQWYRRVHGRPPGVTDIRHLLWRCTREYPAHGETLEQILIRTWGEGRAPSLFELPETDRWGNFLYPVETFFGPAAAVKGLDFCRNYFTQLRRRGDHLVLLNAQQDDWGVTRGEPAYTGPQVVPPETGYWDNPGGFIEICRLARSFGLQVICGLVDQQGVRRDWEEAADRAADFAEAVRDEVAAFWTTWEIDEVLDEDRQHAFHDRIEPAVGDRPWGPHFADGQFGGVEYWRRSPCTVLWLQYGFPTPDDGLAAITAEMTHILDLVGGRRKHLVAAEHSDPRWQSEDDANRRAGICWKWGAEASLNGMWLGS